MNQNPPISEQTPSPDDEQLDAIVKLGREISALHLSAAAECALLIENLIDSQCKDVAQIEHLLDRTLDACAHDAALPSYKRLCRYYAKIDREGAVFYANAYFEMWGDEEPAASD